MKGKSSVMTHWAAYAAAVWSLLYIPPHVYYALGGTALLPGKPSDSFAPVWVLTNWGASVALLLAALLALALTHSWKGKFIRTMLLIFSWLACLIPILHASYGFITKGLYLLGVLPIHFFDLSPWEAVDIGAYMAMDLLLFEPWFMVEGILFGLAVWRYQAETLMSYDLSNH